MYRLVIIVAFGIGLGTGVSRGVQAPAAGTTPQTAPDPNALDRVLKNLQDKAAALKSYQVNMDYLFQQPLLESRQRRTGVLYYAKSDKKSDLRIDFRTLRQDENKEQKYEQQYLFDGVWLLEIDQPLKTATQRQLAEPNQPLDALSLASKQVPVLGFSQVDDLRKQFEIELVPEPLGQTSARQHLHLKVKPDSVYKDDYTTIDLWIDGKIGLPAQVNAVTPEEDVYEIKLTDPKVNAQLDAKLFQVAIPRDFSMEVIPLAKRAGGGVSDTEVAQILEAALERRQATMDADHVSEQDIRELIEQRAQTLLGLADYLANCPAPRQALTRPLVGDLLSHSMQLEELLDTYDAGKNCNWCSLRSATAAIKLFSDVGYELLHVRHRVPTYHLIPVERDFVAATNEALGFASLVLSHAAKEMLNQARRLGFKTPPKAEVPGQFEESLPKGRLAHDCGAREVDTVAGTVTLLATAFLNLASECEDVRATSRTQPQEYTTPHSTALSEERLRSLEFQFHNLQSQYDTYVSGTKAEHQDTDLPVLRGHASVVFHLLRIATLFAHYYERHVNKQRCTTASFTGHMVEPEALQLVLMNYPIAFIDLYTSRAVSLCQKMLKRYAEVGQIEVSIPKYRGFHVRPSTLVAKLVLHYGSKVQMLLGDETYDASSSLDLFRANEKINAQKRRWLAKEIVRLNLVPEHCETEDPAAIVRSVVLALAQSSKLVLYEQPLELPDRICSGEGTLLEKVTSETAKLLAMGKIDIGIDVNAQFVGDKRVLCDIQLLAEHGYGEDNYGNNVPLPKQLGYLRR